MNSSLMIPKLRFPAFSEKWEPTTLDNNSDSVMYGMNSSAIEYDGKHGYIRITDIDDNNCFSPNPITSPDGAIEGKFRLNRGDIVFARTGANTGKSYLYKESDGEIYFAGFLIKVSIINAVPEFIYQNTFRAKYDNWVHVMSRRSGQPGINAEEYKSYAFNMPEDAEQQKIANFLSSIDKKVSLLKEKDVLLEQYKKGVMQKLFSQDIRFKDENGNEFPDWQAKTVGDFMIESRIKGGSGLTAKKITVKLWGKGVFEKNENISGSENTQYYQRKSGQFIYSKLDFLNCAFGLIPDYLNNFETTVDLPCFDISNGINKYLILEMIKQKRFYKKYGDMADGSRKAKRIHAKDFLSFPLDLPSEEEQNKMASFLQAIDKKIQLVSQQIEQTQTFKKGLLQQMFV